MAAAAHDANGVWTINLGSVQRYLSRIGRTEATATPAASSAAAPPPPPRDDAVSPKP